MVNLYNYYFILLILLYKKLYSILNLLCYLKIIFHLLFYLFLSFTILIYLYNLFHFFNSNLIKTLICLNILFLIFNFHFIITVIYVNYFAHFIDFILICIFNYFNSHFKLLIVILTDNLTLNLDFPFSIISNSHQISIILW